MTEEPTTGMSADDIDLTELSDEDLQRLAQRIIAERERRLGLEPGPDDDPV
jgi:hypothetical protein